MNVSSGTGSPGLSRTKSKEPYYGSVCVCDGFEVKVGMHQGSALSPLLFVFVMEALSRESDEDIYL